ncbi:MAG TPA: VacJ family lipoprotein [Caulobacteraceae bacterium]|jgi:phospholipid-binding lipoprotein MlaA|nr:VacJ family lipoprotein [Caulobacteraceae bacterium]
MLRSAAAAVILAALPVAAHAGGLGPSDTAPAEAIALETPAAPSMAAAPDIDFARADPWEQQNRKFFKWNERLDARVVRPTALGYQHHMPGRLRRALRNILNNLSEPVVFANDVLQLHFTRAAVTAFRFTTNSTVGVLGVFDVAARDGAEHHANGFGTTMGHYGVPAGPYLYLPVLGPSTVRDLTGDVVDGFADPFTWARYANRVAITSAKTLASGLDTRARADVDLQALMETATDPYATLRSVYLQNRQSEIEGDLGGKERALPDFDDPPAAAPATPDPKLTGEASVAPVSPAAFSDDFAGNPALENSGLYDTRLQQTRPGE